MADGFSVVNEFLQHSLRMIEQMAGREGSDNVDPGSSAETGTGDTAVQESGREAQARMVKLLVLFIRNLITRHNIDPQRLFFEVQEICVRYIWIREVRELQQFLVGGQAAGYE
jgi:hypothetical protein